MTAAHAPMTIDGAKTSTARQRPAGPTTAAVLEALIRHYRKPGEPRSGEILIPEPQAPGSTRRCDLLRVGMWASRGTGIDVHEIKVSRSDWLRELDDPAKAEAWWPYCSRFWIVAPPGVVAVPELPEGWGLMELPSSGRRFKVRAPAAAKKATVTVPLLVELLRRADNQRLAEMDQMCSRHADDQRRLEQAVRGQVARAAMTEDQRDRLEFLDRLEKAFGGKFTEWSWEGDKNLDQMTAEELAVVLADARASVSAQRREHRNDRRAGELRKAAVNLLKQLDGEQA